MVFSSVYTNFIVSFTYTLSTNKMSDTSDLDTNLCQTQGDGNRLYMKVDFIEGS